MIHGFSYTSLTWGDDLTTHDVIVIGAGPAGSEAAFRLASLGYDVLVLEKNRLNREKVCSGGIQRGELDEYGFPPNEIVGRRISRCLLVSKNLSEVSISHPTAITVMRSKYDYWLQTRARDRGAEFLENTAVKKIALKSNPEITVKSGSSLKARLLIDASGSESIIRKNLNLFWKSEDIAVGIQYHIELSEQEIEERIGNCCEFYFDSSKTPEGYYWIFPKKDIVAVGMGGSASLIQSGKINLKNELDFFVNKHPLASPKLKGGKARLLQSAILPVKICGRLVYENSLIVGDAGGFINPLHKGGVFPARKSAEIASKYANAFLELGRQENLYGYESEIQSRFYEQNYKWDRLIQNIFADDEIADRVIQKAVDKQSLRDSLKELLMFFSHRDAYNSMKKDGVEIISSLYPITASEASRSIIMIPRGTKFKELPFNTGSTLIAVSYCIKSFECPEGRFSIECNEDCNLCDMSKLKRASVEMGFDFRIATDDDGFVDFLEDNAEKYKSLIAIVCPYTTNKIGYVVHKIFGLKGCVIPLRGDVCTSEDKYMKGVKGKKSVQTKTDLKTFFDVIEKIKMQGE